jgi:hypothetical protein
MAIPALIVELLEEKCIGLNNKLIFNIMNRDARTM